MLLLQIIPKFLNPLNGRNKSAWQKKGDKRSELDQNLQKRDEIEKGAINLYEAMRKDANLTEDDKDKLAGQYYQENWLNKEAYGDQQGISIWIEDAKSVHYRYESKVMTEALRQISKTIDEIELASSSGPKLENQANPQKHANKKNYAENLAEQFRVQFVHFLDQSLGTIDFDEKFKVLNDIYNKVRDSKIMKSAKSIMLAYFYEIINVVCFVLNWHTYDEAKKIIS